MEIRNKVIVVTGGASGIGAALCRRFAAEGARGVVVADRDGEAAQSVAKEIGGLAVPTDVAIEAEVVALADCAVAEFGPIDLFCSNAGIAAGGGLGDESGGPFSPDEDWERSWRVHVMAHVYATRAVLPAMLDRGEGAFLHTASAAGLLTDVSGHAYSVTKHATVAFAEWLAIAYGERGIRVACLCPQGVRTPMLMGGVQAGGGAHLTHGMIEPEEVAEAVVNGLAREEFLILPHPDVAQYMQRKAQDPDRWLRGMQRMRARFYPEPG
ncbi:MAG: SDR family oxidoreductase [Myxococcota bacterium]